MNVFVRPDGSPVMKAGGVLVLAAGIALATNTNAYAQWDYGEANNGQDTFYSIGAPDYDGLGELEVNCFYWDIESEVSPVVVLYMSERQFWNLYPSGVSIEIDAGANNGRARLRNTEVHPRGAGRISVVGAQTADIYEYDFVLDMLEAARDDIVVDIVDNQSGRVGVHMEITSEGAANAVNQLVSWCELY